MPTIHKIPENVTVSFMNDAKVAKIIHFFHQKF